MSSETLTALKPYLSFFYPITMWILLVVALYAMYLGVQVRRTRLADGNIKKEVLGCFISKGVVPECYGIGFQIF